MVNRINKNPVRAKKKITHINRLVRHCDRCEVREITAQRGNLAAEVVLWKRMFLLPFCLAYRTDGACHGGIITVIVIQRANMKWCSRLFLDAICEQYAEQNCELCQERNGKKKPIAA